MLSYKKLFPLKTGQKRTVDGILEAMSIEEKIGQMISPGSIGVFQPSESAAYRKIIHLVEKIGVGGVVLFRGDIYAYFELIEELQSKSKIPILFSADFERGLAMRITNTLSFPLNMALAKTGDLSLAQKMGKAIATECRALGVSMNFAPVVDLAGEKKNPVINTRAYGSDKELVASFAESFIKGASSERVLSSAKHFPGHGYTTMDSHRELPLINRTKAKMLSDDIYPFRRCINAGVQSIMMGHLEVPAFEKQDGLPATLSRAIVTGLLRNQLGFDGLVVSDAMNMNGVTNYFSAREAAVLAVQAGNDMLLLPPDEEIAFDALVEAVKNETISAEQINASVRRILYAKMWAGLFAGEKRDIHKVKKIVSSGSTHRLAREIAEKSVSFSKGALKNLPSKTKKPVFCLTISDKSPSETETYFSATLKKIMPGTENIFITPFVPETLLNRIVDSLSGDIQPVLPVFYRARSYQGRLELPPHLLDFFNKIESRFPDCIYIFLGNPFLSEQLGKGKNTVLAYGDVPISQTAVIARLTGMAV
ncbi:MAG: hypothetical protein AMXMBFR48_18380 [Ignavibacteriales bacterium]